MTTPHKWIIIKLIKKGENPIYKVFASWYGGYLDGDYWQINSGISEMREDDDSFYFYGYSGSCYICNKKGYGVATSFSQNALDYYLKQVEEDDEYVMEILDKDTNWNDIIPELS